MFSKYLKSVSIYFIILILRKLSPRGKFRFVRFLVKMLRKAGQILGVFDLDRLFLDGYQSTAFACGLRSMYVRDYEFDLPATQIGFENLAPGGGLLISGHFLFNFATLRLLHEMGHRVSIVYYGQSMFPHIAGCREPLNFISANSFVFVRIKRQIEMGSFVLVMIDDMEDTKPSSDTWPINTPLGPRFICQNAIRFAGLIRAPLYFSAANVNSKYEIVSYIHKPSSADTAAICKEFELFLSGKIGDAV